MPPTAQSLRPHPRCLSAAPSADSHKECSSRSLSTNLANSPRAQGVLGLGQWQSGGKGFQTHGAGSATGLPPSPGSTFHQRGNPCGHPGSCQHPRVGEERGLRAPPGHVLSFPPDSELWQGRQELGKARPPAPLQPGAPDNSKAAKGETLKGRGGAASYRAQATRSGRPVAAPGCRREKSLQKILPESAPSPTPASPRKQRPCSDPTQRGAPSLRGAQPGER